MDNTRRLNAGLPHGDGPWTCLRDEEANAYAASCKRHGDAYYDFVAENGAMFHCPRLTMSTGGSWPGEPSVRPGPPPLPPLKLSHAALQGREHALPPRWFRMPRSPA